jgi:hypothetical protein
MLIAEFIMLIMTAILFPQLNIEPFQCSPAELAMESSMLASCFASVHFFNILFIIAADPWSVTMTSVANSCCMGVTGILLVSSALVAASLIPTNVNIIYISIGLVAGKLNSI